MLLSYAFGRPSFVLPGASDILIYVSGVSVPRRGWLDNIGSICFGRGFRTRESSRHIAWYDVGRVASLITDSGILRAHAPHEKQIGTTPGINGACQLSMTSLGSTPMR